MEHDVSQTRRGEDWTKDWRKQRRPPTTLPKMRSHPSEAEGTFSTTQHTGSRSWTKDNQQTKTQDLQPVFAQLFFSVTLPQLSTFVTQIGHLPIFFKPDWPSDQQLLNDFLLNSKLVNQEIFYSIDHIHLVADSTLVGEGTPYLLLNLYNSDKDCSLFKK